MNLKTLRFRDGGVWDLEGCYYKGYFKLETVTSCANAPAGPTHQNGQQYDAAGEGELPWTFIEDVDANNPDDICFKNEPLFCGLFAETALNAENIQAFLEIAVRFVNKHLWGNLTATVIVHPSSFKDGQVAKAVEFAVTDLRYGKVLLNQYAGLGTFAMTAPWGAYPGNIIYDIQSSISVTFNTLMFDRPQKTVVRSPFIVSPDPFSPQSKTLVDVSRRLAEMQYKPPIWKMSGMLWSAIRS